MTSLQTAPELTVEGLATAPHSGNWEGDFEPYEHQFAQLTKRALLAEAVVVLMASTGSTMIAPDSLRLADVYRQYPSSVLSSSRLAGTRTVVSPSQARQIALDGLRRARAKRIGFAEDEAKQGSLLEDFA